MMPSGELLNDMAEHRMPTDRGFPLSVGASPAAQKEQRGELISRSQVLTGIPEPHIHLVQLHFKLTPEILALTNGRGTLLGPHPQNIHPHLCCILHQGGGKAKSDQSFFS